MAAPHIWEASAVAAVAALDAIETKHNQRGKSAEMTGFNGLNRGRIDGLLVQKHRPQPSEGFVEASLGNAGGPRSAGPTTTQSGRSRANHKAQGLSTLS